MPDGDIDIFMSRVTVHKCGCWEWGNACMEFVIARGGTARYLGKAARWSWAHIARKPISRKVIVTQACGNLKCVNPEHLRAITYRRHHLDRFRAGFLNVPAGRGVLLHKARMGERFRANNSKLDAEKVRYIRSQPKERSAADIGREVGVKRSAVERVRKGTTWQHIGDAHGL